MYVTNYFSFFLCNHHLLLFNLIKFKLQKKKKDKVNKKEAN